ncbi:MAG: hypothetical protein ABEJ91_01680, partial [Candidatus Nanohaloarchaea archaeon]
ESFRVGQGSTVNVAYKDTNYALPVSFTLSNPRHGLKGITARDVKYRIKVIDASKTFCDTGWIPVNAYNADSDSVDNDIFPGTSASTGYLTIDRQMLRSKFGGDWNEKHDALTLSSCHFLQPALGSFKTVMLQVRYDYFSQSTLYFQAMSLQYLQNHPAIDKNRKPSKTADTPVKAAITVNSPVLFNQKTMEPQPFAVQATLKTDEYDLKYKVQRLKIDKSSKTTIYDGSNNCQFENGKGEDLLSLTDRAKNSILSSSGRNRWFTQENKPPIFGCVMALENPSKISPSGETLTMGIEANYTVAKQRIIDSFKVYNSKCSSQLDCPLLVTASYNATDSDYDWLTKCTGIDAGNGCSVLEGPEDANWMRSTSLLMTGSGKLDRQLERGEIAFDAVTIAGAQGVRRGPAMKGVDKGTYAVGLTERAFRRVVKNPAESFVMYTAGPDVELEKVDSCVKGGRTVESEEKVVEQWASEHGLKPGDVIAYRISSCPATSSGDAETGTGSGSLLGY